MGWGEPHGPSLPPPAATGTTGEIERALIALEKVGVIAATLAGAAIKAADLVRELREGRR